MGECEEGKNPLLIELVIDNISKYLSFEELKVCRGLNHLWKKTTRKIFLKRCPFILLSDKDDVVHFKRGMTISQFMEIYSNPNHPHPHAQLLRQYRNFSVLDVESKCVSIFYNFMTQVGHQMTRLDVKRASVLRNLQDLMNLVSSKYTPKLEQLYICKLYVIPNYQQSDYETVRIEAKENKHLRRLALFDITNNNYSEIQWLDVFSGYPKLKALSLDSISANILENMATGLVTIRKIDETKLKLTKLELRRVFYSDISGEEKKARFLRIRDLLKTANLPLQEISSDKSSSAIFSALFQHCGKNLKSLTVSSRLPQPFPLMKALEEMVVGQCGYLTFLTKVPNLKSLAFYPYGQQNDLIKCFPSSTPIPLLSLVNFKSGYRKKWKITEMEQLLLWIPNVQNLEMHLNNTTFPLICQHLPNLKKLTVLGDDLDDSGVVGEFDGAFFEGSRSNITYLKALETFVMVSWTLNNGLTEKSVFNGFYLLPKLSKLTINVKSQFSGATMRALKRGIKSVQIRVKGNNYN